MSDFYENQPARIKANEEEFTVLLSDEELKALCGIRAVCSKKIDCSTYEYTVILSIIHQIKTQVLDEASVKKVFRRGKGRGEKWL